MPAIALHDSVGQIVARHPHTAHVFESAGIDYCCGGRATLEQACASRGLDPAAMLRRLTAAAADAQPAVDWQRASPGDLVDHIEQTHHAYLKQELPRISVLLERLVNAHGRRHAHLERLREVFERFSADLWTHMLREEQDLFPAVRRSEDRGSLARDHQIEHFEHEHEDAGRELAEMRRLTSGFTTPPDGCTTYRVAMHALERLERDMHEHVHKENFILFPRATAG